MRVPLAILLYKAHAIPRILEIYLMLNAIPYLALSFTGIVFPAIEGRTWDLLMPLTFAEVATMLWLIVRGTRPTTRLSATVTAEAQ